MEKLVSILVASYNHEKYIEDCLDSIKNQSYKNIELIISDDCSRDNTFSIAKAWCDKNGERFTRCIVRKNENNLGVTKNYNQMIDEAKGDYIKCFASDDILFSNAITELVDYLEEEADDIVFSNMVIINDGDKLANRQIFDRKAFYKRKPPYGTGILKELIRCNTVCAPSVLFRRETIEKYGKYDEALMYEDWEYWLRIEAEGGSIGYIDTNLVAYRILKKSNSHYGKSRDEIKRFERDYDNNRKMLSKYVKMDDECLVSFFNNNLYLFIKLRDKEYIQKVVEEQFRITIINRIRLFMTR